MGFFKVVLTLIAVVYIGQNTLEFFRLRKESKD